MGVTASELRNNVYRLLDRVLQTGKPLIVERKGRRLRIECEDASGRLSRLVKHDCMRVAPESLVHIDWSGEWSNALP